MSNPIKATMGLREWAMLIALSLLWGGSFYFVAIAVNDMPPFTIVWFRVALAAATLWLIASVFRISIPLSASVWLAFAGMGFLNNVVPFSLIVWGQTQIASGLASIFNATTPIFAVVFAHFLTSDEQMDPGRFAGTLLGFCGIVVLVGPDAMFGDGNNVLAQLAIVGAAIAYGCAAIFGRRFAKMGITPFATATGQVSASAIILLPVVLVIDQPWALPAPSTATMAAIVALAVFSTALAYLLYFKILANAGAVNLSVVTLLVPVSAIVLGTFLLSERLEVTDFIGMALIGFGLAAIDGRPAKQLVRLALIAR